LRELFFLYDSYHRSCSFVSFDKLRTNGFCFFRINGFYVSVRGELVEPYERYFYSYKILYSINPCAGALGNVCRGLPAAIILCNDSKVCPFFDLSSEALAEEDAT